MGLANDLQHQSTVKAEAAMNKIFYMYQSKLLHVAVIILKDTSVAEEVVSDTFVQLWINRDTINDDHHIGGFLMVALRYACLNAIKKLKRENRIPDNVQNDFEQAAVISNLQKLDRLNRVLEIIETMPRQTREVFLLHYIQDKTNEQIANQLGISTDVVKTQISRGRKIIANQLSNPADRDTFLMLLFIYYVGSTYSA